MEKTNKQTGDGYCGSQFMDKETGYKEAPESTHLTPTLLWENEIKTLG